VGIKKEIYNRFLMITPIDLVFSFAEGILLAQFVANKN